MTIHALAGAQTDSLNFENDIIVVSQSSNGNEAVEFAQEHMPDVILMDINMPVLSGLQAISEIKERHLPSKIIVLTIHEDREYLFKTLQMGAEGYVLKDAEPDVLIEAIRSVNAGNSFIQPNMTKELVKEFNRVTMHDSTRHEDNNLTAREIEVSNDCYMINKEIAKQLFISHKQSKPCFQHIETKCLRQTQAAIY